MKIIYVKKVFAITINIKYLWLNILNIWAYASRQCNKYLFKCSEGKKHCRQDSKKKKVQKKESTTQNKNDGGPTENDCDFCVHGRRMYVRSYWSFLNIPSAWLSIMRNYKIPNGLFCRDARPKSSRVARTSRPVAVWIWTEDTGCFADSRLNGPHSRAELLATWRGKVRSRLFVEGREGQESHRTRGDGTYAEGSIKRDRPYTLYIYLCAWLCVYR